jgi:outer membrane protein
MINKYIALGAMSALFLASCGDKKNTADNKSGSRAAEAPATAPSGKIAYVNLDTLEVSYEYFKLRKAEFEKKTAGMEAEVERLAQSFQNEYIAFQKKAQAGTLTQSEGEAAQKKLGQMQQNIESRRQSLQTQLMKEQETFNKELQKRLDDYLVKYNADKGYDFILSYVKGGNILFANKALDITADVIKGMNAEDSGKPAASDSAK